jgi:hypothetical protein
MPATRDQRTIDLSKNLLAIALNLTNTAEAIKELAFDLAKRDYGRMLVELHDSKKHDNGNSKRKT